MDLSFQVPGSCWEYPDSLLRSCLRSALLLIQTRASWLYCNKTKLAFSAFNTACKSPVGKGLVHSSSSLSWCVCAAGSVASLHNTVNLQCHPCSSALSFRHLNPNLQYLLGGFHLPPLFFVLGLGVLSPPFTPTSSPTPLQFSGSLIFLISPISA